MAERVYTYDHASAAMCIIEEIVDPQLSDAPAPWLAYREQWGIGGLRDMVLARLAGPCDAMWERVRERYEKADQAWVAKRAERGPIERWRAWEQDNPRPQDPGAFDYEFVPVWLRVCVDWSDVNNGPRVLGS